MTLNGVISQLEGARIVNAKQEALWLMSHTLSCGNAELLARSEFTTDEERRIEAVISRRVAGEPLQYILGVADFYGRDFTVGSGVLIPRHDTETLIEGVKKIFARDEAFRFVDWGTGSGCLAVTILLEFPNASGVAVDVSGAALSCAGRNVERWGVADRLEVGGEIRGEFELVVSNPPYIPTDELAGLQREVRDFEPALALDGGHDGMTCYREVAALALTRLKRGGYLVLEAGDLRQVRELCGTEGFVLAGKILDDGGFPRGIILRRD